MALLAPLPHRVRKLRYALPRAAWQIRPSQVPTLFFGRTQMNASRGNPDRRLKTPRKVELVIIVDLAVSHRLSVTPNSCCRTGTWSRCRSGSQLQISGTVLCGQVAPPWSSPRQSGHCGSISARPINASL